jgi:hypothetical protein
MPLQNENNIVELVNPSNLPVHFEWDNVHIADELIAEFSPSNGIVNPKSSLRIKYKVIYYKSGNVDSLFLCQIREMDIPLGIVIQGRVTGLDITYEMTDDTLSYMMAKYDSSSVSSSLSMVPSEKGRSKGRLLSKNSLIDKTLNVLDFRHLQVNKHQTASFLIKNHSGIQTTFNIFVERFKAGGLEKTLKNEIAMTKTSKTEEASEKDRGNLKFYLRI